MDLNKQKLLRNGCQSNIGEAEDRISELPDLLLHHILSFLDIKPVARTCLLSKRWKNIWLSIPILELPCWYLCSDIDNFIDFVDRTLLLHDTSSNIEKFCLKTDEHMRASQLTASLLTTTVHLPKSLFLPKLKNLKLRGLKFTDDCWNEQHISNCPVLENFILDYCTWFGVRSFCISSTSLKRLEIDHGDIVNEDDGLQDCALKIKAPNLVSFTFRGGVAKEYVLSSFQTLEFANVGFSDGYDDAPRGQKIDAAIIMFFQALAYVQSLTIYAETLEAILVAANFVNNLPTFRNLKELFVELCVYTSESDKSVFPLLRAAPNLSRLVFTNRIPNRRVDDNADEDNWDSLISTTGCLFQHLRSVCFMCFNGNAREMRWLKLILRSAKALQTVTIGSHVSEENKHALMSEFPSLPKASGRCVLEFS